MTYCGKLKTYLTIPRAIIFWNNTERYRLNQNKRENKILKNTQTKKEKGTEIDGTMGKWIARWQT